LPAMLQMRIADPDEPPIHAQSFEAALKQALLAEFPVAAVVEKVDDKFIQLLETMAALDLNWSVKGQHTQGPSEMSQASTCGPTDRDTSHSDHLSRAA
jgi:hypothetical protein